MPPPQHLIAEHLPAAVACALAPETILFMPQARSLLFQRSTSECGDPLLLIYHRNSEISFNDPRHFAFAENLVSNARFRAGDAAEWGNLGWDTAAEMLIQLIAVGILHEASAAETAEARHHNQPYPSPLSPATMQQPRSWMDGDSLMLDLTGSALDPAYLELVVPIFRTGHLFLDRDGRQIGEANVFPAAARLDVPTEWRGCPYVGNRYQSDRPMNATALRAMRQHWRAMMALLINVRASYLSRFPDARKGWTVGDVERLSTAVLALPSFMMLRCDAPVANGDLHPALSNLFRVADGLRMVMHQMLFVPLYEPMLTPDAPIDPQAILDYADRNFSFHSDHGVCAGPRFMIEDFLSVILDGEAPRGGFDAELDPELYGVINLIEPALDYAMLGLQAFGTVFSLWPAMTRCYEQLHDLVATSRGAAKSIADRFETHFANLSSRSFLASEEWRQHREAVYDDMVARCNFAMDGHAPRQTLSAMLTPAAASMPPPPATLTAAAARLLGDPAIAQKFAQFLMDFLLRGQRIVAVAENIQARTAALLHRPKPAHRLTLAQLNLHNVLMGLDVRTVPFLPEEISALMGIDIRVDADAIQITDRSSTGSASHSSAPFQTNTVHIRTQLQRDKP